MSAGLGQRGRAAGVVGAIYTYLSTFAALSPNAWRLLAGNLCINVGVGVTAVLFNLYLVALGLNLGFVGFVAALSTVSQAAVAPFVGRGLQRYGARVVMAAGAGAMALAYGMTAVVSQGVLLAVASALSGVAFVITTVPAGPYMMEHASARQRSHLFSAYFASNTIGNMLGSLLSGGVPALAIMALGLRAHDDIAADRYGLLAGAVVTAAGVWLFLSLRPEAPAHDSVDRPVLPAEEGADDTRLRRDVLVMLAATGLIALAMGATMPFFNVYFASRLHAGTGTIGAIYAVSGAVCAVMAFLAPAVGRWGRLRGFSASRIVTAPIFMLFWLHPGLTLAAVAYTLRNAAGTVSGALENAFAMEVMPARTRATVASWRSFAFNATWSVGSLIAGAAVARLGYEPIFVAAGALTLVGSVVYYRRFVPGGQRRTA